MSTAWHDTKLLNSVANGVFAVALMASLAASLWWLSQRPMFSIRQVRVEADPGHPLRYVHEPVLRTVVGERVGGNFFALDLQEIRAAFEAVPWVRRATVRRVWPDSLHVTLEEHRAFAIWNHDGLLNTHGESFSANLDEADQASPRPVGAFSPPGLVRQAERWHHAVAGSRSGCRDPRASGSVGRDLSAACKPYRAAGADSGPALPQWFRDSSDRLWRFARVATRWCRSQAMNRIIEARA